MGWRITDHGTREVGHGGAPPGCRGTSLREVGIVDPGSSVADNVSAAHGVGTGTPQSAPRGTGLVGRHVEQAVLRALLSQDDEPALAVCGEPGIGKTALIDQFCRDARAGGWRVARVIGVPAEQHFVLAGLHQIVFSLQEFADDLSERSRAVLAPVYGGEPGATVASLPLVGAVLDLLAAAATSTPLLLTVDDVQWFDDVSAQVLSAVGRRVANPRIRIVVGMRTTGAARFSAAGWRELSLHPLSSLESEHLLDRTETSLAGVVRDQILEAAAGNPLALTELPRCANQIDVGNPALPLTHRLVSVFAERSEQLEPSVRATILRAALDGSSGSTRGVNQSRYEMRNVQSAIEAGLLMVDPLGRAVFRHPLVQSAIVYDAEQSEIREAHRELAALYGDVLLRQAFHLAAATAGPDQEVSDLLVRAAKLSGRRGGLEVAVKWLRRAAELNPDPQRRERLFGDAVFVAARAGKLDDTRDLLDSGVGVPAGSASAILADAYREFHRNGDAVSAHGWLLDGLSRASSLDDKIVSRLAHLLVSVTNYLGDEQHWVKTNAALAAVDNRLNPAILMYRTGVDDIASTSIALRTALLGEYAEKLPRLYARQVMLLAFPAYCVDAMDQFRGPLRIAYTRLREYGASIDAIEAGRVVMLDLFASGHWQEAEQVGSDCLEMSESTRGSELRRYQLLADLGLLAAGRGDVDVARMHAAEVRSWAKPRHLQRLVVAADRTEVRVALSQADYGGAYRAAARTRPDGRNPGQNIHDTVDDLFDCVEAAARAGQRTDAARHAQEAMRLRLAEISPRTAALALAMTAMTGSDSEAGDLYQSALDHPGLVDSPFQYARVALAQGVWLRSKAHRGDARAALEAAADTFDRLGARPWSQQARFELRALGAPTARSTVLTTRERRVAELAATGESSRQIAAKLSISTRTVDAHLYRVFSKLGISRRAELGTALQATRHCEPLPRLSSETG